MNINNKLMISAILLIACTFLHGCGDFRSTADQINVDESELEMQETDVEMPETESEMQETKMPETAESEPKIVEIESLEAEREAVVCEEGASEMVVVSVVPAEADISQVEVAVKNGDTVSARTTQQISGKINLYITGLKEGETEVYIQKDAATLCTINVTVEKKAYSLDELPEGIFYGRDGKIFELEKSQLNTYSYGPEITGWIPAEDFSEDNVPVINRGETIYIKGDHVGTLLTCYNNGIGFSNDLPLMDYFGYTYTYDIISPPVKDRVLLVDYEKREVVFETTASYINGEEKGWSDYCWEMWHTTDPSLRDILSTTHKGDTLTFGWFEGTEYKEFSMTTDMWVAVAYDVFAGFELTKDGYAYYTFPADCRPGYYCLVQYSGDNTVGDEYYWIYVGDNETVSSDVPVENSDGEEKTENQESEEAVQEMQQSKVENLDIEAEVEQIRSWYYSPTESEEKYVLSKGTDGWNYAREYYFHDGELYFAFVFDGTEEHRLYFKDGVMIRYIDENKNVYDYGNTADFFDLESKVISESMQFAES